MDNYRNNSVKYTKVKGKNYKKKNLEGEYCTFIYSNNSIYKLKTMCSNVAFILIYAIIRI